jgi:hypothetical protein
MVPASTADTAIKDVILAFILYLLLVNSPFAEYNGGDADIFCREGAVFFQRVEIQRCRPPKRWPLFCFQ